VGEAVADFRGEASEPEPEMKIELAVDAHLPVDYIESERLRLEMYKRLAAVREEADLDAVRAELLDRYGALPEPVENLFAVSRFRMLARSLGVTEVLSAGTMIRFAPVSLSESGDMRRARLYPGSRLNRATGQLFLPRPDDAADRGQAGHRRTPAGVGDAGVDGASSVTRSGVH
jgi:transcription-repair coupling factor (superfamily II helicase)